MTSASPSYWYRRDGDTNKQCTEPWALYTHTRIKKHSYDTHSFTIKGKYHPHTYTHILMQSQQSIDLASAHAKYPTGLDFMEICWRFFYVYYQNNNNTKVWECVCVKIKNKTWKENKEVCDIHTKKRTHTHTQGKWEGDMT